MRLVVQRVSKASVLVDKKVIGEIGKGLFVLLGVKEGDTREDVDFLVQKLSKMRIMSDKNDKMNLSVKDVNASVLVVSQFTLHANTKKGNRPSFIKAAKPDLARDLYKYFVTKLIEQGVYTETGKFGGYMEIDVKLDGPVTILLESNMEMTKSK